MGQVRQILKHVHVETANTNRACRRNRAHRIAPGDPCLVIRDEGAPFTKTYCADCALPILKRCATDLRHFRDFLYGERLASQVAQTVQELASDYSSPTTIEADSFIGRIARTGTDD